MLDSVRQPLSICFSDLLLLIVHFRVSLLLNTAIGGTSHSMYLKDKKMSVTTVISIIGFCKETWYVSISVLVAAILAFWGQR